MERGLKDSEGFEVLKELSGLMKGWIKGGNDGMRTERLNRKREGKGRGRNAWADGGLRHAL